MITMLAQFGMIERFGLPGERSACYRVKPAYWRGMMQAKMGFIRRFHELAERTSAGSVEPHPRPRGRDGSV